MNTIRIDKDSRGVATLWLTRAEKHNAMSGEMIADLHGAATGLGADAQVRVVILAAEGKSFCAGADLGWMRDQIAADAATRGREAGKLAAMLGAFDALPKPLIARVHGNAFGGGLGLISVSDVAVGVATARFALTETRLGLIPATIGPYVIARMGLAKARRVFYSGRVFDGAEAVDLGLLARVVDAAALDAAVETEIVHYLACAPGAVAEAKALARHLGRAVSEVEVEASIAALVRRWDSDEAAEGVAAFFDKRPPVWGRGPSD